ncbi:hypothetical protein ACSBOB_24105 [Mesorhizobium sp. ASY16-5R]|uniref:hypothetical protein n=1 Tax=Mesorhizobium sp. ASY16-5R TaxID=3445772 RepID=UPI003F9F442F
MTGRSGPQRLTPDGKPLPPRRTGDEGDASSVDGVEDTAVAGDAGKGGYANTDEVTVTQDGLVRRGDQRDRPLV